MFALVDCNSFYASCERLFRPDLRERPIVVLSNNDGCAVAMCDRAKALGIRIGTPHFQIRDTLERHGVVAFSSNYALYGDISRRVMATLARLAPAIETYSIDEAFLDMRGIEPLDLREFGLRTRSTVLQNIGIPTCVGIGPTKALAKVANRIAKKFKEKTQGVCVLDTPERIAKALAWLPIEDVWGIGRNHATRLQGMGVRTAADFLRLSPERVRQTMSVVGLRLQMELQGTSCLPLELMVPAKKAICTSRSFGTLLTELAPIEAAVAHYANRCARKLRAQRLCARTLTVLLQTNPFQPGHPQRFVSASHLFAAETSDSLEIVEQSLALLRQLWKPGYRYKKAGVIVQDTVSETQVQGDLFDRHDRSKARKIMVAMDTLNHKYGSDLLGLGIADLGERWKLRSERLSPRYTTDWAQLMLV